MASPPAPGAATGGITALREKYFPELLVKIPTDMAARATRADLARDIKSAVNEWLARDKLELTLLDQRDLVTGLLNGLLATVPKPTPTPATASNAAPATSPMVLPASGATVAPATHPETASEPNRHAPQAAAASPSSLSSSGRPTNELVRQKLQPAILERIDTSAAAKMSRSDLARDLADILVDVLSEQRLQLNAIERQEVVNLMLDDMLGLGPLEPLLSDEAVSEVMVNGPKQVWIERKGKLELSGVQFRDNAHVLSVCTRIVTAIGRRIDESSPLCDARLADGSRVNIIIPPLAIDGPALTIRKFSKKKLTLDLLQKNGSMSAQMLAVLRVSGRCRLNILISGGTGSGKTTLLNAMSQMIDPAERIVTIEDAAELQLQQPHVVRLETRPANLEGHGEITMRDLLKNSLRMRPDRIIVGETRGGEAIDMLQAMNTGHDGSLSTVHANRPREAVMRLENMVGLAGVNLAPRAIRQQIASAVDMIIQVSRMRDGGRRITHITEIVGMEGEIITMQDLFTAEVTGETPDGKLIVDYKNHGLRPHFLPKAAYFGLERQVLEVMK